MFVSKYPIGLNNGHKVAIKNGKSCDAGNSDMPRRSHKGLSLSKKVTLLNKGKEKKHAGVAKIYRKNKSTCETVKIEAEIRASFAVALQTAKVMATRMISA